MLPALTPRTCDVSPPPIAPLPRPRLPTNNTNSDSLLIHYPCQAYMDGWSSSASCMEYIIELIEEEATGDGCGGAGTLAMELFGLSAAFGFDQIKQTKRHGYIVEHLFYCKLTNSRCF